MSAVSRRNGSGPDDGTVSGPSVPNPEVPHLQDVPAVRVAYIAARGTYELLPGKMVELATWFGKQAIELGGQPGASYFNGPDEVSDDELEWEVWIPTPSVVRERESVDGQIGVKTIAAATCATLIHLGPYETLSVSTAALLQWAKDQGHRPDGPFQTVFLDDPADVDEHELRTIVRFAVKSIDGD